MANNSNSKPEYNMTGDLPINADLLDAEAIVDEIETKLEELAALYRNYCDAVPSMRARVQAYALTAVDALRAPREKAAVDELRDEAIQLAYPEPDEDESEDCPCVC
jgi:hypothetical protein